MTVSVVIPSYNRRDGTLRAVRSALSQDGGVGEIIVVDDASDQPLDNVSLQALDPRVRIYRMDRNGGAAAARQLGVDRAKGEFVAFLDSDDWWEPHKLSSQLPLLRDCRIGAVAISCGWREIDGSGIPLRVRMPKCSASVSDFVSGCWFCPGSTVLLPRQIFETVGPLDAQLRRLEDLDWFMRFGAAGGRLLVAPSTAVTVVIGRRGRTVNVEPAARRILAKAQQSGMLSNTQLRRLRAWLAVERSRAALNDGRHADGLAHLVRSFALAPRLRVQLKSWWRREP